MKFSEACKLLQIEAFPEEMDAIWEEVQNSGIMPFTRDLLVDLQERYNIFEDYYEAVLEGFDDLSRDEARRVWAYTIAEYAKTHTRAELCAITLPKTDSTPAGHMAPLFPLIVLAERGHKEYLKRGFSEEEARNYLRTYRRSLGVTASKTGKPGLEKNYFNWSSNYAFCCMFNVGGFNFQFVEVPETTYVIRSRKSGEIRILLHGQTMHQSGMVLGTIGLEDPEGSYDVAFEETESEFIGYPAVGLFCPNEKQRFSKEEWEMYLSPGNDVFALHIPKGTDISPAKLSEAISLAYGVVKERFPEKKGLHGVRCTSWLLSPQIEELLGSQSNIARFGNAFVRFPVKNNAGGVYTFAFKGKPADLNDLEENTTLQRKVKEYVLAGGYIYNYSGYIAQDK